MVRCRNVLADQRAADRPLIARRFADHCTQPFCRMTLPFRRSLNRFADHSTVSPITQPFCRSLNRFTDHSTVSPITQPFRRLLNRFADHSTVLPNDSTVLPIAQPFRRSLNRFAETSTVLPNDSTVLPKRCQAELLFNSTTDLTATRAQRKRSQNYSETMERAVFCSASNCNSVIKQGYAFRAFDRPITIFK